MIITITVNFSWISLYDTHDKPSKWRNTMKMVFPFFLVYDWQYNTHKSHIQEENKPFFLASNGLWLVCSVGKVKRVWCIKLKRIKDSVCMMRLILSAVTRQNFFHNKFFFLFFFLLYHQTFVIFSFFRLSHSSS